MKSIVSETLKESFRLKLTFNSRELCLFDATPYLEKGVFKKLKKALFNQAYVAFDIVCWFRNLNISSNTLHDKSDY